VIPIDDLILLDTNIILRFVRTNLVGRRLESDYKFRSRLNRSLSDYCWINICACHEIWGGRKKAYLNTRLNELAIVDLNLSGIIDTYARIDYFSEKMVEPARPMGQNDIWIAATAATIGVCLMTTDNDFDHLHSKYIQRIKIDAKTGKTIAL